MTPSEDGGDRTRHWPAIERKHGRPMAHWFAVMDGLDGRPYAEQMACLQGEHGFSRAHANAVVMYARGSTSSRRFDGLDAYLAGRDAEVAHTVRQVMDALQAAEPELEMVIAWNQPMLRAGDQYVFGVSAAAAHVLLAPWGAGVLDAFRPRLGDYVVNKKTLRVPAGWRVDAALLADMLRASMAACGVNRATPA